MNFFEDKDRWSSQMISNGARNYLDAAKSLQPNPLIAPHPFWFCIFQSIELSLKAFLRGKGYSKKQLKAHELGHHLAALYDAAKLHGLDEVVSLSSDEEALVRDVGEMYSSKVFQYAEAGWSSLPYAYQGYAVGERFFTATRHFAEAQRTHHHDKPTAVR